MAQLPNATGSTGHRSSLTAQQRRMWLDLAKQANVGTDSRYVTHVGLRLVGPLNPSLLEQACRTVARRQPALRTRFIDCGAAVPLQETGTDIEFPPLRQLSIPDPAELPGLLRSLLAEPFRLINSPLFRVVLIKIGPGADQHELVWLTHHLIFDGWSAGVLIRELSWAMAKLPGGALMLELPPAETLAADYQRSIDGPADSLTDANDLEYWRETLAGYAAPTGVTIGAPSATLASHSITIPPAVVTALKTLCHKEAAPITSAWVALFALLLSRRTGQEDQLVVMPTLNRSTEQEALIGCFAELVLLRCQADERRSFVELLCAVASAFYGAIEHAVPYDLVVAEVLAGTAAMAGYSPLPPRTDDLLNWGTIGVKAGTRALGQRAHLGAVLETMENPDGSAAVTLIFDTVPDEQQAQTWTEAFAWLAEQVTERPNAALIEVWPSASLAAAGRAADPQDGIASPADAVSRLSTVADLLTRIGGCAGTEAVRDGGTQWSYSELAEQALRVAAALRNLGIEAGDRVAVQVTRGTWAVAAALGVMAMGAVYVPCDADGSGRLAALLSNTPCQALVTDDGASRSGLPTACVSSLSALAPEPIFEPVQPDQPAYVIHTSGSTGQPKGVQIRQASLLRTVADAVSIGGLTRHDRVGTHAAIGFDASLWEWLPVLAAGGTLVFMPDEIRAQPTSLWSWAEEERITLTLFTTSLLTPALAAAPARHPSLRLLETGAEAWTGRASLAPCPIVNIYGPTEGTIAATAGVLSDDQDIHIGRPLPAGGVYLLDRWLRLVPDGAIGQIYLGAGREADGYLNQPGLTARSFIADPIRADGSRMYATGDYAMRLADGNLRFLGRRDRQIKVRGVRLELDAIASVIQLHPMVRSAACIVAGADGDAAIHAFYTGTAVSARELRELVLSRLPRAAVPSSLTWLPVLPVNLSGKVDQRALAALIPASQRSAPPPVRGAWPAAADGRDSGSLRQRVSTAWLAELGGTTLEPSADFFELGGDSLKAVRICGVLSQQLQIRLSLADLFSAPTFAEFCSHVERQLEQESLGSQP